MSETFVNQTNFTTSRIFWESRASYYVGVYGMFVLAVVGILSNTITFFVFGRFKRQTSTTLYLQALALADLISLSSDTIVFTALPLLGVKIQSASYWACKICILHDMASSTVASCALLVVALDRFAQLNFPTFHKSHGTRKKAMIVSVGLWVVTYLYCSPLMYFYELSSEGSCGISLNPYKADVGLKFVTFITYGPYFSIPVVGIIISNVSIVKLLFARKKNRDKMGKSEKYYEDVSSLLVINCMTFLVLIGIVATLWALAWQPPISDHQSAVFQLMFVLAQFISCIEESIDFFLYLSCSKAFRREILKMFGLKTAVVDTIFLRTTEQQKAVQIT